MGGDGYLEQSRVLPLLRDRLPGSQVLDVQRDRSGGIAVALLDAVP